MTRFELEKTVHEIAQAVAELTSITKAMLEILARLDEERRKPEPPCRPPSP